MAQAEKLTLKREPNGPAYIALRERLIVARKAAGLTQETVAARLGRPQSFIAKVETGERSIDVVELLALAQVIKLDLNEALPAIAAQLRRRNR